MLREGHAWSKRHVTIPIEQVDYAAREVVYLKVDKAEMESMATPPMPEHRPASTCKLSR